MPHCGPRAGTKAAPRPFWASSGPRWTAKSAGTISSRPTSAPMSGRLNESLRFDVLRLGRMLLHAGLLRRHEPLQGILGRWSLHSLPIAAHQPNNGADRHEGIGDEHLRRLI